MFTVGTTPTSLYTLLGQRHVSKVLLQPSRDNTHSIYMGGPDGQNLVLNPDQILTIDITSTKNILLRAGSADQEVAIWPLG